MERHQFDNKAARDVQAYLEYDAIVGNADGGKMMSEKEYEEFKNNVREARKNRLYVNWRNEKGMDCKTIGPSSSCFCGHRYKQHDFDAVDTRIIKCREAKCKCKMFEYVPVYGSRDLKCLCKHSYKEHDVNSRLCS